MLFSSITFLYYFLPAVLVVYFIVPKRFKNFVLLLFSLLFYFWGEPVYVLLMLFATLNAWVFGFWIDKYRGTSRAKAVMIVSAGVNIALLAVFKYSDFFVENVNHMLSFLSGGTLEPFNLPGIILPIGISFYTFQILSYTFDLYRGNAALQKSFLSFATYVTLFPQLIAGPIVRYTTVADELDSRVHSLADFSSGAFRFAVGLGKKVLLANTLGELCETYKNSGDTSVLFTWLYVVAYALHIYFDFSGYSDMAIGLGRIFGFHFLENFNYPYIADTVTDFWRRWHISLSTWFRDYVYIPLGGNRVSKPRRVFNIFAVWLLTGFWHGAGWTFIAWGMYFAVWLLIEKHFLLQYIEKLPKLVRKLYIVPVISAGWVLFDAADVTTALSRAGQMFGIGAGAFASAEAVYYLRSYLVTILIALFGATPLIKNAVQKIQAAERGKKAIAVLEPLIIVALMLTVTAYLIDGSFNPFIYFRF